MSFKTLLSQLQGHLRQRAAGSPCLLTAPALRAPHAVELPQLRADGPASNLPSRATYH